MKFKLYNKQVVRNEIIEVGSNYPLFHVGENCNNCVIYPSQDTETVELKTRIRVGATDNYIYEVWRYCEPNGIQDSLNILRTVGYEVLPEQITCAERYYEI